MVTSRNRRRRCGSDSVGNVSQDLGHFLQSPASGRTREAPGQPCPPAHHAIVHLQHLHLESRLALSRTRIFQTASHHGKIAIQGLVQALEIRRRAVPQPGLHIDKAELICFRHRPSIVPSRLCAQDQQAGVAETNTQTGKPIRTTLPP